MKFPIWWVGTKHLGSRTPRRFFEKWSVSRPEWSGHTKRDARDAEGRYFKCTDLVFPFLFGSIDWAAGYAETPMVTNVSPLYTAFIYMVMGESSSSAVYQKSLVMIRCKGNELKRTAVRLFGHHCDTGLDTANIHWRDPLCEDVTKFGTTGFSMSLNSNIHRDN